MRPRFAERGEKLLVHLSNFRPVKRVTDVVEVFAQVAEAMPARLMLIGDGPDRSAAEYLARSLGVQDRIHFLGKQDNVNELLPVADLMLMPSEMESFGLAALEAMACRVPAIATRVGGVPELIDDGVNGILCDVGDVDAMARQAIALLSDPTRLEAMPPPPARPRRTTSAPPPSSHATKTSTASILAADASLMRDSLTAPQTRPLPYSSPPHPPFAKRSTPGSETWRSCPSPA